MDVLRVNASIARLAIGTLVAFAAGCTSISTAAARPTFDGTWHVRWCDASRPGLDCGGFSITLVESADRICGTYSGARVGLGQVDDGEPGAIKGVRLGNSAVMTLESARSGDIYLIRAERVGDRLSWKVVDDIHDSPGDVDVIAIDDTLEREPRTDSARQADVSKACAR